MGQILIRKSCDFFLIKKTPHFYGCYKISDATNCVFFIKKIFEKNHPLIDEMLNSIPLNLSILRYHLNKI